MAFPEKIKAIVIPQFGDVDVIQLGELPFPVLKPHEVLVKVQYAGVNFADTRMREGSYPSSQPGFPLVLGGEAGGVIVKLPSDPKVLENEEYKIRAFKQGAKVVAAHFGGAMTEYIAVPWMQVFVLPHNVDAKTGAAAFMQGLTAITFVTEAHNVQKGETILVHTVAGGLGLLFAQLCHARGATVIGTTSTEEKAKVARAHGADHVIVYTKEDTVKRVLEITNGEGVHATFDGVGKDTFDSNFKMLRLNASLISLGNASGQIPPFDIRKLTEKNTKLMRATLMHYIHTPSRIYTYSKQLFDLVADGTLKIHIEPEYPFTAEGVQQAHQSIGGGKNKGKLLVKVSE